MSVSHSHRRPQALGKIGWPVIAVGLVWTVSSPCGAQTMNASPSAYATGYGASLSALSGAVNTSLKDSNGNLIILDGVIKSGNGAKLLGLDAQTGVQSQGSGVGVSGTSGASASALAIGNNVTVTTTGSNNTVIVNAVQTNTGPVQATIVLNGQLNLSTGG